MLLCSGFHYRESPVQRHAICNAKFFECENKAGLPELTNRVMRKRAPFFWMPPRAWRSGLEPAELSFRVPHFFHQTRKGSRGVFFLNSAYFTGSQKIIKKSTPINFKSEGQLQRSVLDGRAFSLTCRCLAPRQNLTEPPDCQSSTYRAAVKPLVSFR